MPNPSANSAFFQAKAVQPKPSPIKRFEEFIDVDVVEAVIKEANGIELAWLKDLLETGIRVRNTTGRYLKNDRFLKEIKEKQWLDTSSIVTEQ